jgi:hypothetical protein
MRCSTRRAISSRVAALVPDELERPSRWRRHCPLPCSSERLQARGAGKWATFAGEKRREYARQSDTERTLGANKSAAGRATERQTL